MGNVSLFQTNLSKSAAETEKLGVDVPAVLDPYSRVVVVVVFGGGTLQFGGEERAGERQCGPPTRVASGLEGPDENDLQLEVLFGV